MARPLTDAQKSNLQKGPLFRKKENPATARNPLYRSWHKMIWRCANVARYRDRGVSVCDRWHDFQAFTADMGPRPAGTSLERINNDGNYEPANCRWATTSEQSRNKRNNRFVTFNGKTQCLADWAKETGISYPLLRYRLLRGWAVERLFTPPEQA
jgi:hypothetical protein